MVQIFQQAPDQGQELPSRIAKAFGGGVSQGINGYLGEMFQNKQQMASGTSLAKYLEKPEMASTLGALPQKIQSEIAKAHFRKRQEEGIDKEVLQTTFDDLVKLSDEIGYSPLSENFALSSEAAGKRGEFETLKAPLIAAMRDMVNKGILSNQKFQHIVNKLLPAQGDRKSVKKRKLSAIAKELKLNSGGLDQAEGGKRTVLMRDPSGNLRKVSQSDAIKAQKAGYKLEQ